MLYIICTVVFLILKKLILHVNYDLINKTVWIKKYVKVYILIFKYVG